MELHIAGKDVKIHTGIHFLREIDKRFSLKVEKEGIKLQFGSGLTQINMQMNQKNPTVLFDLIECAVAGNRGFKPNSYQIEEYLDGLEDDDFLFEDFDKQLAESNKTKKIWNQLKENQDEKNEDQTDENEE